MDTGFAASHYFLGGLVIEDLNYILSRVRAEVTGLSIPSSTAYSEKIYIPLLFP